ncbi:uncharacterized protein RCO7_11224 [Rhynchosporium graminicola]|uniref:Uncharacterized protein n=1 Tax=Rhynchosporium graminicola TaxID=2792576 RepID=A0A1E1LB09_9HELO|nr:uncharacterized protein RCO7_11224 [Rhynchosporium commune]
MAVELSIFLLLATSPTAIATNSSGAVTVGWVSDPAGRGTFSLLFSSLLTLGLCVWSAMHLNIPPHDEQPAQSWMKNFKWGLIGVFAPELIVFAAWRQYNSAKALHAEIQGCLNAQNLTPPREDKRDDRSKRRVRPSGTESIEQSYPWTMVHSFYAGMGGFTVESDVSPADGGLSERLTLSARGIAFLAKCGHLPNIDEDDIKDKSKADGLSKFLVCVQAGWMVVQVIGRLALRLPVTLLEVNILGHVLCALVIYVLWWHKPRLVYEPTKLEGNWVTPICAYMYLSSQVSGWKSSHAGILRRTWIDPELAALAFFTTQAQSGLDAVKEKNSTVANEQQCASSHGSTELLDVGDEVPAGSNNLGYFGPRPLPSNPIGSFAFSSTAEQAKIPSTTQLTQWRLAADAVRMYPTIRQRFAASHSPEAGKDGYSWLEPVIEELVTKSASNWPGEDLLRGTGGLIMGMVLWFASMAYGGLHIAAWNDYFPSTFEAWMWRSSSICITASAFVWLMINLLAHMSKSLDAYWDRVLALQANRTSYLILGSLCFVCGAAYVTARIFLVVEAFISIRQLPMAAYGTPDWTQLIPHL